MGKPMLLWAEGAGKNRYIPGEDSCGASLKEMADICAYVGMLNAVNLDGGGSAQILVNNSRSLKISDRKKSDNSEEERPVPLALMIE
jgi:exopolysaccharide biosynthesis protein